MAPLFSGQRLQLSELAQGYLELRLDNQDGINKFDRLTLAELNQALSLVEVSAARGLIICSAQKVFFAGGDIDEFVERFSLPDEQLLTQLREYGATLNRLENLACPTVCLMNGATLGGGVELALACDARVVVDKINVGLPEVSLGIMPGTGGCVRLPRLVGVEQAAEWIVTGAIFTGAQAHEAGLMDACVNNASELKSQGLVMCENLHGPLIQRGVKKAEAVSADEALISGLRKDLECMQDDDTRLARKTALDFILDTHNLDFSEALEREHLMLARLGKSPQSTRLVARFMVGQA